jgi:hypothetical protein
MDQKPTSWRYKAFNFPSIGELYLKKARQLRTSFHFIEFNQLFFIVKFSSFLPS